MNQQQKRYVVQRVDKLVEETRLKLLDKCEPVPPTPLTAQQAQKMIKNGTAKLKSNSHKKDDVSYVSLSDVFDFSGLKGFSTPKTKKVSRSGRYDSYKVDAKKYDTLVVPYTKKAERIKDKIVLSDGVDALKLIQELEAYGESLLAK